MIKYIIFDFDDTLSDFQLSKEYAKEEITPYLEQLNIIPNEYWTSFENLFEATFARYINHELTVDEYRIMRFLHHGIDRETAAKYNDIYMRNVHTAILFNDVLPTLKDLNSRGYRLYVFSNGPPITQRIKIEQSGIAAYVDEIFISAELGEGKPSKAAYDAVIKRINAPTEEILMVGDSYENDCVAAENAGLHAVQINRRNKPIINYQNQISSLSEIYTFLI